MKRKSWKRIQNNDSKDDQKPWKQNREMQESINKDLEELMNKHAETNNTIIKLKILWKESIAQYQKQRMNQWAGR